MDQAFDQAIRVDPMNPGCIRFKMVTAIEQGALDEAEKHFEHLMPHTDMIDPSLFGTIARAYEAKGEWEGALRHYAGLKEHYPGIEEDAEYRGWVRRVEKKLGHTTSIVRKDKFLETCLGQIIVIIVVVVVILGIITVVSF